MTQEKKLVRNSIAAIAQIVIAGGTLFLLYAFLIRYLGVKTVGVWSFVMALSSLVRIGELGLPGSVVKFVAKYLATTNEQDSAIIVQTAFLWVLLGVGIAAICFYPLILWALQLTLNANSFKTAEALLPYACIFYLLGSLVSVLHFALDGCQKITVRSGILIVGGVGLLFLVLLLVPEYGLLGLLISQIIQIVLMGIVSYYFLRKSLPSLPIVPCTWSKGSFQEMVAYGLNFNTISVAEILFEPSVKYMLAKFGGLSSVVYYEMSSRLVIQLRAAFVAVNRVLVPYVAGICEISPEQVRKVYMKTFSIQLYLGIPLFGLLASASFFIAYVWIGYPAIEFVVFLMLLSGAWFLNALSVPAFYSNLGTGELKWNALSYIFIVVLSLALGHILGQAFGSYGVVIGWITALVIGSCVVMYAYHRKYKLRMRELFPANSRAYLFLGVLAISICVYTQLNYAPSSVWFSMLAPLLFAVSMFVPFWIHPLRLYVFGHLRSGLRR